MGERPAPDTLVVTSRAGAAWGAGPWRRRYPRFAGRVEVWAAGPATARALRTEGFPRVRCPSGTGADAIGRALGRTPVRRVLYLRSDRAGDRLARRLRRQGHTVVERVVYRTESPVRLSNRSRRTVASADLLVVTSPSGLSLLRRGPRSGPASRLFGSIPLVVLGRASRTAAVRLGFRHVSVAPSTEPVRFTRHLLRVLDDALA
jgi:uroporphyrinogen-III synthase